MDARRRKASALWFFEFSEPDEAHVKISFLRFIAPTCRAGASLVCCYNQRRKDRPHCSASPVSADISTTLGSSVVCRLPGLPNRLASVLQAFTYGRLIVVGREMEA